MIDFDLKEFMLFFDRHLGSYFDFLEGNEICDKWCLCFLLLVSSSEWPGFKVIMAMGFLADVTVLLLPLFTALLLIAFFSLSFYFPYFFLIFDICIGYSVCFLFEFLKVYSSSISMGFY